MFWFTAEAPGDDDVEEDDLAEEDDEEDYEEDEKPPAKKAKAAAKPAAKGAAGKAAGGKKGGQAVKGITHTSLGLRLLQSYPPASRFFPASSLPRTVSLLHPSCIPLVSMFLAAQGTIVVRRLALLLLLCLGV